MPQQQVTYRIKNERTGQWWEGKADSPVDAMRKAALEYPVKNPKSGWTAENCWVRLWCSTGYGSWVTLTMAAKTTEMVKA
ncbi:hypothetical protein DA01_08135 [Dehalococcoides mccartyi]|jgi:hypothetical protein|uniref:Uncharacterized protein n=1 Tax=Dehalococcoides mccartyi TaxID=61435 RepID=A0A0V8LXI4_9CHLR|nr:hypothetical protein DA01_08135 [Dehalococcoides mccartyi]